MHRKTKSGVAICPFFTWTSEDIEGLGHSEKDVNLTHCINDANKEFHEGNCQESLCPLLKSEPEPTKLQTEYLFEKTQNEIDHLTAENKASFKEIAMLGAELKTKDTENAKLKTAIRKHLETDDVFYLEKALEGKP